MPSIFSKIINGEIPCHKIAETNNCIAILDAFPLVKGHTLIIPKLVVDKLFDLSDVQYIELMAFAKQVSHAIANTVPCNRVSMHVIGLEVPHAHIHLIPINTTNDCNFSNSKLKFTQEEFESIAANIARNFSNK